MKTLGQAGPAQVDVKQKGSLAGPSAGGGEVQCCCAFTFAGLGACDQQRDDRAPLVGDPKRLARMFR